MPVVLRLYLLEAGARQRRLRVEQVDQRTGAGAIAATRDIVGFQRAAQQIFRVGQRRAFGGQRLPRFPDVERDLAAQHIAIGLARFDLRLCGPDFVGIAVTGEEREAQADADGTGAEAVERVRIADAGASGQRHRGFARGPGRAHLCARSLDLGIGRGEIGPQIACVLDQFAHRGFGRHVRRFDARWRDVDNGVGVQPHGIRQRPRRRAGIAFGPGAGEPRLRIGGLGLQPVGWRRRAHPVAELGCLQAFEAGFFRFGGSIHVGARGEQLVIILDRGEKHRLQCRAVRPVCRRQQLPGGFEIGVARAGIEQQIAYGCSRRNVVLPHCAAVRRPRAVQPAVTRQGDIGKPGGAGAAQFGRLDFRRGPGLARLRVGAQGAINDIGQRQRAARLRLSGAGIGAAGPGTSGRRRQEVDGVERIVGAGRAEDGEAASGGRQPPQEEHPVAGSHRSGADFSNP